MEPPSLPVSPVPLWQLWKRILGRVALAVLPARLRQGWGLYRWEEVIGAYDYPKRPANPADWLVKMRAPLPENGAVWPRSFERTAQSWNKLASPPPAFSRFHSPVKAGCETGESGR
jgi:hypothetical protein